MDTIKDFAHVIRTDDNLKIALMVAAILMMFSPFAAIITASVGLAIAGHQHGLYRGDGDQQDVAAATTHTTC